MKIKKHSFFWKSIDYSFGYFTEIQLNFSPFKATMKVASFRQRPECFFVHNSSSPLTFHVTFMKLQTLPHVFVSLYLREQREVAAVGNYMVKVNNRNTRIRFEICSKLCSKYLPGVVLVSLLLTLNIFHTLF